MLNSNENYTTLDISDCKDNAEKTIDYLNHILPDLVSSSLSVIVLGESHDNSIDKDVTKSILEKPPVIHPEKTRVVFERSLDGVYHFNASMSSRTEVSGSGARRRDRSTIMAKKINQAFDEEQELVYLVCGFEHAAEVYEDIEPTLKKKLKFFVKPSSV